MIDTSNTSTTTKYWRDMDTGCGATDTEHDLVASGGSGLCPNAKRINFAHIGDVAVVIVGAQCVASIQIESAVDSVVLKVRAAFLPALLLPLAKSVSFSAYPSRTLFQRAVSHYTTTNTRWYHIAHDWTTNGTLTQPYRNISCESFSQCDSLPLQFG